ncbi:trypsin-like peptidase domain-containing protein [Pseudarthrobacter sp. J64]|uniref:S1C family serine protease n=1 Tax=Pseudarthrobacter sp. J64 TaxID=3116485 RepID=UPI002E8188FD|nr:trypsin-like peptidase domain-containing protein [Pseudarthrobacter sp. J64]MEE2567902.1 trypsin-like peptidase domain-containing protein [Pseudarthrobacter sp. J64]
MEPSARTFTRPGRRRKYALPATFFAAVLALAGCTGEDPPSPTGPPTAAAPATTQGNEANDAGTSARGIPQLVEDMAPSMVTIFTEGGLGSGVVYSAEGLILTNEHVIRGSSQVEVGFADGQRVPGEVRAADEVTDLALIQVDRTNLPAPTFQTTLPRVGEDVIVMGSPLGFENTVTAGIISGLHRAIPDSAQQSLSLVDLIQTDAPISPGNSGGAVVNMRGEVVGISEAYIPPQAGAVALGFAIPAATAVEVAEELLADGTAEHAYLGLTPGALTAQIADQLGIEADSGIVVLAVDDGGPAGEAGLEPGDVLESIDGVELRTPEQLLGELRKHNPGDTVQLRVLRDGDGQDIKAELIERPVGNR